MAIFPPMYVPPDDRAAYQILARGIKRRYRRLFGSRRGAHLVPIATQKVKACANQAMWTIAVHDQCASLFAGSSSQMLPVRSPWSNMTMFGPTAISNVTFLGHAPSGNRAGKQDLESHAVKTVLRAGPYDVISGSRFSSCLDPDSYSRPRCTPCYNPNTPLAWKEESIWIVSYFSVLPVRSGSWR